MSLILPLHPHFSEFREIEAIAEFLKSVTGSALTQPAPALLCGCNLQHESDALPSSGPPLLPFMLDSTLVVFLRGDIQLFTVLGASHPCNPGKISASGMMPGLSWVLLQSSRLQPSPLLLLRPWVASGPQECWSLVVQPRAPGAG